MAQLAQRFETRLTVVCAGAGFGKTTLLAQALADPPVGGRDVLVNLVVSDRSGRVIDRALEGLGASRDVPRTIEGLADVIWTQAPNHVCLVLDDIHRFDTATASALVAGLVDQLPANGHLLVAGRVRPAIGLERLRLAGQLIELGEDDLAFSDEEVVRFLATRGRNDVAFSSTRWPALLELECTVGVTNAERYLGEEILSLLPASRLDALTKLCVVPEFDLDMIRALTEFDGSVADLVDGVPLVRRRGDTAALHDIWLDVLRRRLSTGEVRELSAAASAALRSLGRLESAAAVAADGGDDDGLVAVARLLVHDFALAESVSLGTRVLQWSPARLATRVEVVALEAAVLFATDQTRARSPLERAIALARACGDVELELLSIIRLAEIHFRCSRAEELGALRRRLDEIEGAEPARTAVACLVGAWHDLLGGRHAEARAMLEDPLATRFAPIVPAVTHYRKVWWAWLGDAARALTAFEEPVPAPTGRYSQRASIFTALLRWHCGVLRAEERATQREVIELAARTGERHLLVEAAATVAMFDLSAGDVAAAQGLMALAADGVGTLDAGNWGRIALAQARAVAAVMAGDERTATDLLVATLPAKPPDASCAAHVHTNVLALSYLLVPGMADVWDSIELGPEMALGRRIGQALVALRAGDAGPATRLPWRTPERLRTWACEPLLAELALGALAAGNREARAALDQLRSDPGAHLARLWGHPDGSVAAQSRRLAAEISRRPARGLTVRVLGPLTVLGGDEEVVHPHLRRARVRELFGAIVHHRRISRRALCGLLWPDKTEPAAANNLRVTLNQLNSVLEPDRSARVPAWFIRSIGDDLVLEVGDTLTVDVDEFERAIQRGRHADAAGRARDCLEAYLDACSWYRGDYLADAMAQEEGYLDQLRLRSEYATAATRAAQLLVAQGRAVEARELAGRAAALEPFLDAPHVVLADAYDAEGRPDLARRVIEHHLAVLNAEGLTPSTDLTDRLQR